MHPIVTVPAPAAYSMKPRRLIKGRTEIMIILTIISYLAEHISPGPAAYRFNPTKFQKSAPAYSLSSRVQVKTPLSGDSTTGPTPGPTNCKQSIIICISPIQILQS